ncbi:hypothetical protein QOZ80_7AG0569380 [Eleusine coracana subsp. coracana]|nr:hypothetical protein QOZ80_7AG0569380 [Eleusine coracana subsp. coracana]
MDLSSVLTSPSYGKAAETYKKAVAAAATAATYTMMARSMSRDLFPDELRGAARWAASVVRARLLRSPKQRRTKTIFINQEDNRLYDAARSYLATRIDPHAATRHCLVVRGYVPFIMAAMEEVQRQRRTLQIFMNRSFKWRGITHRHPATFDTLAMDSRLKQSIVADLDRFLKRKDYYRRIGKAWKRGYLLYGLPGTGKSSLVAAMANHLRFNIYDLDLSEVWLNSVLQKLLIAMPNKCILLIEDIDCCFDAAVSRENGMVVADVLDSDSHSDSDSASDSSDDGPRAALPPKGTTLSGLLNFIDGLWSTCGEERVIVFTTNYKDRLDPALLRPGRMDMHIYMGYCGWEAFKTLAKNYFLLDDHPLFGEIQDLLEEVEVTPAEVSEMLLRSEDADVALQGFVEFLQDKKKGDKPSRDMR